MHTIHKTLLVLAISIVVLCSAPQANAYVYIEYGELYTDNSVLPVSEAPWLSALFEDIAPGKVMLTLNAIGLTGTEFATDWYFNFTPSKDIADLTIDFVSGTTPNAITVGGKIKSAGGGVDLPILISFDTANKDRFEEGDTARFILSGLVDLSADDFNIPIFEHDELFIAVAHLQGLSFGGSAWVKGDDPPLPAPEPQTWMMMLTGLVCLLLLQQRRRKYQ